MAKLAIKGHETRGKEVIELLEMLGGKNAIKNYGNNPKVVYHIDIVQHNWIRSDDKNNLVGYTILTLEEFLEKFPYKVGDKVKVWISGYRGVFNIQDIAWDSIAKEVKYKIRGCWLSARNLQPYKEETVEEQKKDYEEWFPTDYLEFENNDDTWADEVEVNLGKDYEIQIRGDKTFIVKKKPQYPNTIEECAKLLNTLPHTRNGVSGYRSNLLWKFQQLLICRDAYWKIAGEQMGLRKPWKSTDDKSLRLKYVIQTIEGKIICLDTWCKTKNILEFPTTEMRDVFYENFNDLIEECKDFL